MELCEEPILLDFKISSTFCIQFLITFLKLLSWEIWASVTSSKLSNFLETLALFLDLCLFSHPNWVRSSSSIERVDQIKFLLFRFQKSSRTRNSPYWSERLFYRLWILIETKFMLIETLLSDRFLFRLQYIFLGVLEFLRFWLFSHFTEID